MGDENSTETKESVGGVDGSTDASTGSEGTSIQDGSEQIDTGTAQTEGENTEVPPAYVPNFKYKVYGEDKELPEKFRSLIKTQEDEKEVRDIFERADAIEGFKRKNDEARARYDSLEKTVKEELAPTIQHYHSLAESLRDSVQREDFLGVCEALGINPDAMLGIAAKEAALRQNPESYRAAQAERNAYVAQKQVSSYEKSQQQATMEVEARYINRMFDLAFTREDVKKYASDFDARMGQEGSFLSKIREQGEYHYLKGEKKDPIELIDHFMKMFPMASQPQVNANAQPVQGGNAAPASKATIPSVPASGGSALPKKKQYQSIKEMQKDWAK